LIDKITKQLNIIKQKGIKNQTCSPNNDYSSYSPLLDQIPSKPSELKNELKKLRISERGKIDEDWKLLDYYKEKFKLWSEDSRQKLPK
jgi:hypothetical protein